MESNNRTIYLVSGAVIILIAIGAYFLYAHTQRVPLGGTAISTVATTTNATTSAASSSTNTSSGKTGVVSETNSQPSAGIAPAYKTPVTCPSSSTTADCAAIQARDAQAIASINTDSQDHVGWLALGAVRSQVGDYTGAIAAWNYSAKLTPTDPTPYFNLGGLYMNNLKDYPKAEANYLLAVKYQPGNTGIYQNLFQLYSQTSYVPSTTAAENILKTGIAANPQAYDLQVLLARYYVKEGRVNEAKAMYVTAQASATASGQSDTALQIQAEASKI